MRFTGLQVSDVFTFKRASPSMYFITRKIHDMKISQFRSRVQKTAKLKSRENVYFGANREIKMHQNIVKTSENKQFSNKQVISIFCKINIKICIFV